MMAKNRIYNVAYRRRREGKTNYKLRKRLISSGVPRIAARKSQKHITAQLIQPTIQGDKIITSAHSSELRNDYGYLGNLCNIPAAYLTGLLCGYRASIKGVENAILDIGLHIPSKGSKVFAVLKGILDSGISVPYNDIILPDEARISGQHIASYASKIAADPEIYSRIFSKYLVRGLHPEDILKNFFSVKNKISSHFNNT